jgi:arylsulfatase A-like enzyme
LFAGEARAAESRPNILFVAIDDLNDWIGCLGTHPQVRTPNMDALAKRGTLFTEAHCPAPVCGPCRAAVMSGLWPASTGVYSNNASYRKRLPDAESLPEYLGRHGYRTMGAGKLFHGNSHPEGAFDLYAPSPKTPWPKGAILSSRQKPVYRWKVNGRTIPFPRNGMPADRIWKDTHTFDWGPLDIPDGDFRDAVNTKWSCERLGEIHDRPFFLGMGFHLPHQPMFAPRRFHEMYPLETVALPPAISDDLADLSQAGRDYALLPTTSGTHGSVVRHGQWENAVSSYLATVTFVDHLLGRLLESLKSGPHASNTWIVVWSDHGWHLGEKEHWGKATGWYRATRVPLIIVPPAGAEGFERGSICRQPVNLLDLFATVVEMAGLPGKERIAGRSLVPIVKDPRAGSSRKHTVTTFGRGNHAITTRRFRFIQYFDGSAELYDRSADPNEWRNLIADPAHRKTVERLGALLPEEPQWKHFVRYRQFKAVVPADGSPLLLFNQIVENHLEERDSEAANHPEVAARIGKWLKENPTGRRRLVMPAARQAGEPVR